jgi:hypothetical protein
MLMKKKYLLFIILGILFILWNTPVLYPLKLLIVFFHESSHALTTLLTGGEVAQLVIVKEQGGYVLSRGGNRFLILNSGYLGSLLWGSIIYLIGARTRWDKTALSVLGILVGLTALWFAGNLFTVGFGVLTGLIMVLCGRYLNQDINDFLLRLIGLTSMVYVPFDIFSDTIYRSYLNSDAQMLAVEYGGTTMLWGISWIVISAVIILYCLRRTV